MNKGLKIRTFDDLLKYQLCDGGVIYGQKSKTK